MRISFYTVLSVYQSLLLFLLPLSLRMSVQIVSLCANRLTLYHGVGYSKFSAFEPVSKSISVLVLSLFFLVSLFLISLYLYLSLL